MLNMTTCAMIMRRDIKGTPLPKYLGKQERQGHAELHSMNTETHAVCSSYVYTSTQKHSVTQILYYTYHPNGTQLLLTLSRLALTSVVEWLKQWEADMSLCVYCVCLLTPGLIITYRTVGFRVLAAGGSLQHKPGDEKQRQLGSASGIWDETSLLKFFRKRWKIECWHKYKTAEINLPGREMEAFHNSKC